MQLKTVLLAATMFGAATSFAVAQSQSGSTMGASGSGNVSAATHCKDASGQIKLKTAANSGGGAATSGSAATGGASSGGKTGAGAPSGSGSGAGSTGSQQTTSGAAATLPNC